ncbi:helix-turn-helix transcriptional regulator [Lapillicoccus jejuensis]|uniref:Regulatory LuxR family protein n=1 Tax=Lapillicoccus jejuensis TaxID=402171 RepID=A0A542DYC4_9MICO|nr:helix-turn-helix transcriptional regulator [Lapillicoccus jejuensis]TQJ08101.1 regulatory LuxR family protein [Lapillicoccus jejuensis]
MRALRDLGASPTAEAVYVLLVDRGRQDVADLAAHLDTPPAQVHAAVGELRGLGLVAATDDGPVQPLPPRAAIEALAEDRSRQAEAARRSAQVLGDLWAAHVDGPSYLEVLTTTEAVAAASRALHDRARTRVDALSIGPVGRVDAEPAVAPGVAAALARGVAYRVVYGARILQHPVAVRAVTTCIAQGEEARVYRDVPLNLTVGEGGALLMVGAPGTERLHGLLVRPSDLYDRLSSLFEVFWSLAVPLTAAVGSGPNGWAPPVTPAARLLVTLMAAGLTDESIARELGVSERTVARRIAALQRDLGVQSRFQLGVQAGRRGLL